MSSYATYGKSKEKHLTLLQGTKRATMFRKRRDKYVSLKIRQPPKDRKRGRPICRGGTDAGLVREGKKIFSSLERASRGGRAIVRGRCSQGERAVLLITPC